MLVMILLYGLFHKRKVVIWICMYNLHSSHLVVHEEYKMFINSILRDYVVHGVYHMQRILSEAFCQSSYFARQCRVGYDRYVCVCVSLLKVMHRVIISYVLHDRIRTCSCYTQDLIPFFDCSNHK
jgi:hypothetical protein